MTLASNAADIHPSNAYWYLDTSDMQPVEPPTETVTAITNRGFTLCWNRISASIAVWSIT